MSNITKAYLAVAFICIAWGTTYLAIRIGVMHYPAFLFAGIRQVLAGSLMAIFALVAYKKADFSKANVIHNLVIGFFMITVGNGIVSYAEREVPSGIAALICSMMPLNAVLLNIFMAKEEKLNPKIIGGLILALCGVGLIFRDNLADLVKPIYLFGIISIYIGTISWAYGSIRNRKTISKTNPILNASMQLFFGGLFLLIFSPLVDSFENFEPWQPNAWMAMTYLIVVGSFGAFTAYLYALKNLPVGIVTSYAYVNPLVAVILGYIILDEKLTIFTAMAFATIVTGVYLVSAGYRKQKANHTPTAPQQNKQIPVLEVREQNV